MSSEVHGRLGYLLKHAQVRMAQLNAEALAPHSINSRELAVLMVLSRGEPLSQQEAAKQLRIDRSTMVALLDSLEHKGLVFRRPQDADRRRNLLAPTEAGLQVLEAATEASDDAERTLLARLTPEEGAQLRRLLQIVVEDEQPPTG
jgi:DNA-binding MarR family transcriptional regulator